MSISQPIGVFGPVHLQSQGLDNTGNICCHISIILCLHRLGLLEYLDQDLIEVNGNVLNWSGLVLTKIFEAIPSVISFSPQNLLTTWNNEGRLPMLQAWDDISVVGDMIAQLPFRETNNIPAFTRFLLSYHCRDCGNREHNVENWNERIFHTVPTLALLPGSEPITAELLYVRFLMHVATRCSQCNRPVNGSLLAVPGKSTILHISRNHDGRSVVQTRFIPRPEGEPAPLSVAELVSVVCRAETGSAVSMSHYISYHQVGGQWFLNNDNHHMVRVNHHPFNIPGQTVDMLCYKNNV